jgi:UDP-MurNAc hydroxylase
LTSSFCQSTVSKDLIYKVKFMRASATSEGVVKKPKQCALAFKFIGNACGIFTGSAGRKILCDPWLVDGAFEGSWCHFPKIETKPDDVKNVDAIYISHIHPDHFDERFFDFEKSIPIFVLDHGPNFLIKKLITLGYTNLRAIKDGETIKFEEFELTIFGPFVKHHFYATQVGNLIDSSLLVTCNGVSALNANDNVLSLEAATRLYKRFGQITLAMLNYSAASSYPACFDNLSEKQKLDECTRIRERYFLHLQQILEVLKPKFFLPFAGAYVLGGSLHHRNKYLATATWDECARWLKDKNIQPTKTILLRENNNFDIEKGVSDTPYFPIDDDEKEGYVKDILSKVRYPYEFDLLPDESSIISDTRKATLLMRERMSRFEIESSFRVVLMIYGRRYQIYPSFESLEKVPSGDSLLCYLDERLLRKILNKESSWNSAEVGAHIRFVRTPNRYEPDLHTGLQFFHL